MHSETVKSELGCLLQRASVWRPVSYTGRTSEIH